MTFVVGLGELEVTFSILSCEFDGDEGAGEGRGEGSFDGDPSFTETVTEELKSFQGG